MPQLLNENEVSYYLGQKHIYPKTEGEANVIETVKVNGTALVPDANKAVNVVTRLPLTSHGTSNTTYTLPPNEYHTWGEVSALTITLGTASDNTVVNEYWFRFESGSTPTNITISPSVDFPVDNDLIPEANRIYEVHIVGSYAVWNEWEA